MRSTRRIAIAVAAFVGVLGFGSAGYVLIEGWSLLDALYMTVITVATVGFREVHPLCRAGVVFTMVLIGVGVGAAGTSLLVLLAKRVDDGRRAAAATIVWMMMILGFAVTAGITGKVLDPFSGERLLQVVAGTTVCAFVLALVAVRGVEGVGPAATRFRRGCRTLLFSAPQMAKAAVHYVSFNGHAIRSLAFGSVRTG